LANCFSWQARVLYCTQKPKPIMPYSFKVKCICLLISSVCVLSSTSELFAQKRNRQVVSIGPKIGANLSTLHGDVINQTLQPGLSVGAILTYSVVNTFGISLEALYSQKGAKFDKTVNPAVTSQTLSFNRKLNYVEVPLLARYFLNKDGDFRPNLFLGPNFGFKLNAKDVNISNSAGADLADSDISYLINPVDFGITGGIGMNLRLQKAMRVLLDVRYTYGISDVTDNSAVRLAGVTAPGANASVGNSGLTITAGLSFGIGKKYEK
jgi:outer membrane protein W